MYTSKALNRLRPPELRRHVKQPEDFNRPKVRYAGKVYAPEHPMYESIRKMVLERYSGKR